MADLSDETGLGGMPQAHYAKGGLVRDHHKGLDEDAYLSQFPGLEHHDHDEGDGNHRRYWEPLRPSSPSLIDRAMSLVSHLNKR